MTIEEIIHEMESHGWTYHSVERNGKTYHSFEIGLHPDWTMTPLFTFFYSPKTNEWLLQKGLSQWYLAGFNDPLSSEDLVSVWRICSQYA